MSLAERIVLLQRVADALVAVREALAPLTPDDRRAVLADLSAELGVPAPPPPTLTTVPPAVAVPDTQSDTVPVGNAPARTPRESPGRASEKLVLALSGGPLRVQEIAERAGCSEAAASQGLRNNGGVLFEKVDPANRMSAWRLTDAGQSLASRLTPARRT